MRVDGGVPDANYMTFRPCSPSDRAAGHTPVAIAPESRVLPAKTASCVSQPPGGESAGRPIEGTETALWPRPQCAPGPLVHSWLSLSPLDDASVTARRAHILSVACAVCCVVVLQYWTHVVLDLPLLSWCWCSCS